MRRQARCVRLACAATCRLGLEYKSVFAEASLSTSTCRTARTAAAASSRSSRPSPSGRSSGRSSATSGWIRGRHPGGGRTRRGKTSQPEPRPPSQTPRASTRAALPSRSGGGAARLGSPMLQDTGSTPRSRPETRLPPHEGGQAPAGSAQRGVAGTQSRHFTPPQHGPSAVVRSHAGSAEVGGNTCRPPPHAADSSSETPPPLNAARR